MTLQIDNELLANCEECGKPIPVAQSHCTDCKQDYDTCDVAAGVYAPERESHTEEVNMEIQEAIRLLTDEAERQGATANDEAGIIRSLVAVHGLSFNAWFCVCCDLADRKAKREGFKSEVDRAFTVASNLIQGAKRVLDRM